MMKRILILITVMLLLSGCGKEQAQPVETTAPTEPPVLNLYVPQSTVEQQTSGAVRSYAQGKQFAWITPVNEGVLVASVEEKTTLMLLSGVDGRVLAEKELQLKLMADSVWTATATGFAYYDSSVREVVYLDPELKEINRLSLPEGVSGSPAIAADASQVYYCIDETIYAIDAERKISRPVRTNTCESQILLGSYFDGKIVGCSIVDREGKHSNLYISGENGELIHKDNGLRKIYTEGDTYFALRNDGVLEQYLYGTIDGQLSGLNIAEPVAWGTLELAGVLGQSTTDQEAQLNFYNMKKSAAVTLPLDYEIEQVAADKATEGLWMLTQKGELLHWTLSASYVVDETDYLTQVYTAVAPDTEGLKACQKRVDALNKEFGVAIRIWDKALTSNETFDLTAEYQTEAIDKALTELETELRKFPKNFLYKSVARQIRICIVRDIAGEVTSAYHWYDGDPFIILSVGVDMEAAFIDAFAYIVDIHILGNSPHLDTWEQLNPSGFTYGTTVTVMAYLEGETRAFADRKGMQSLVDDRAQVFYHAMLEDNAEVFQSETMQAKLLLLCRGIRDAWRLEKSTEIFLWEQYLAEPIAYKK